MSVRVVYETHSTSEDNERGVGTGWLGGRLSVTGRVQAEELGRRRRSDGIDAIFASDLNRAVETAKIACGGRSVQLDWRLRECDYGELNGMARTLLDEERPHRVDTPFPGGESWRDAVQRVDGFLDELVATHDGRRVLLIGHVATRWALDVRVSGATLEDLVVAEFEWRPGWEYELD